MMLKTLHSYPPSHFLAMTQAALPEYLRFESVSWEISSAEVAKDVVSRFTLDDTNAVWILFTTCNGFAHEDKTRLVFDLVKEEDSVLAVTSYATMRDTSVEDKKDLLVRLASPYVKTTPILVEDHGQSPEDIAVQLLEGLGYGDFKAIPKEDCVWMFFAAQSNGQARNSSVLEALNKMTDGQLRLFGGGASSHSGESGVVSLKNKSTHSGIVAVRVQSELKTYLASCDPIVPKGHSNHVPTPKMASLGRANPAKPISPPEVEQVFKTRSGRVVVCEPGEELSAGQLRHSYIAEPKPSEMYNSAKRMHEQIKHGLQIPLSKVAAVFAIASQRRYATRAQTRFDPALGLKSVKEFFPQAPFVGAYLDGEIGRSTSGKPFWTQWSLSEMVLVDQLRDDHHEHLVRQALKEVVGVPELATVDKAIASALELVAKAGHSRSMISLLFQDGEDEWIVAQDARSDPWLKMVLPETRRKLCGHDVLAIVVKEKRSIFIDDARKNGNCVCSETGLAERAGIVSFYATPIFDESGGAIGVLQIDLGDMSQAEDLPIDLRERLDSVGSIVSLIVNQAIRAEELRYVRQLDKIMDACLAKETRNEAFSLFVRQAADAMKVNVYVRMLNRDNELELIDGVGEYYEASKEKRKVISYKDEEPATWAKLQNVRSVIVNDSKNDPIDIWKRKEFEGTPIGFALNRMGAHARFAIGQVEEPIQGIVCFNTNTPWFFTPARARSWADMGRRLAYLNERFESRESETRYRRQLQFLRDITPPLKPDLHAHAALRKQIDAIAKASGAVCASCYLWDDMRTRYVLRAEFGWHNSKWLDAAWFSPTDAFYGPILGRPSPVHVQDVRKEFPATSEKYLSEMSAEDLNNQSYEAIYMPLRFQERTLGLLAMYRHKMDGRKASPFIALDESVEEKRQSLLNEAAEVVSTYLGSLLQQDREHWRQKDLERRQSISLEVQAVNGLEAQIEAFCKNVVKEFGFQECSFFAKTTRGNIECWGICRKLEMNSAPRLPDQIVLSVFNRGIWLEQRRNPSNDPIEPNAIKNEQIVERIVLPIFDRHRTSVIGAIDLSWKGRHPKKKNHQHLPHHDRRSLNKLTQIIGDLLFRTHAAERTKLADHSLDGIAAGMGKRFHELGNTLKQVQHTLDCLRNSGETGGLLDKAYTKVLEEIRYIETVKNSGWRLSRAVREYVEIAPLVRQAIQRYQPDIDRKGIEVILNLPEKTALYSFVDPILIRQCFENSIQNAVRALPAYVVGETMTQPCIELSLFANESHSYWIFECNDNGPGIGSSQITSASDKPVHKVSSSESSKKSEGVGIGNLETKINCESHGGTVTVGQGNGRVGTKVSMKLPIIETRPKILDLSLDG